jgi:hypothetical protein
LITALGGHKGSPYIFYITALSLHLLDLVSDYVKNVGAALVAAQGSYLLFPRPKKIKIQFIFNNAKRYYL